MLAKVKGNYICITKGRAEPIETGEQFSIQLILLPTLFGEKKRQKLSPEANLHEHVSHRLLNSRPNVPWQKILLIFMVEESSQDFCIIMITGPT